MSERRVSPDVITYSVLIDGLCKDNRMEEANQMLDEMCVRGLVPNDVTYTTLIGGHCKQHNIESSGRVPGVATFNVVMNGFCKQGQMKIARMLLDDMHNLGVVPDDITYNILLEGHCNNGGDSMDIDKLQSEKGHISDIAAYTSLISISQKNSKTGLTTSWPHRTTNVEMNHHDTPQEDDGLFAHTVKLQYGYKK
ncbi:hypothetical protein MKW98_018022 [Papaver atlanticum]|uniref:Pentatricopeptide repeat-containing protein n=1 Tax=Papaver atlanticum TaxID=357466 RepID=A0AAD4TF81_9MAGN|nr:hypothetical protein MKW98_018022 [Papaver atlanticum]